MTGVRERWLSARAVSLHAAVLVFVPGCALAAWWQISRAQSGNQLSYLYSVMWPAFAILGVCFWWMLIHTDFDSVGLRGMRRQAELAEQSPAAIRRFARRHRPVRTALTARARPRGGSRARRLQRAVGRVGGQGAQHVAQQRIHHGPTGAVKLTQRGLKGTLYRYQLMANIVGVLIIPLFFFFFLHLAGAGSFKLELAIFGVGHGYLYIVYLITAGLLAIKARLHIPWIILMFAAGLIPGVTFLTEWLVVTKKIQPLLAAQAAEADAGVSPAAR